VAGLVDFVQATLLGQVGLRLLDGAKMLGLKVALHGRFLFGQAASGQSSVGALKAW